MPSTPHIVVVDDEADRRDLTQMILRQLEPRALKGVGSVPELLMYIAETLGKGESIDLVLMDINMPGTDGIEGCRQMRQIPICHDIPILMLTAANNPETLKEAFEAGAMDYIVKTSTPLELITRVKSALRLKQEMDKRKEREEELLVLTRELMAQKEELQAEAAARKKSSYQDELTGVYNAQAFDQILRVQWNRTYQQKQALSMMLVSIDFFNEYNLHYGRAAGDELLKKIVKLLPKNSENTFVLRYDGSVFAVMITEDNQLDLMTLAEKTLKRVREARIEHATSEVDTVVSVSMGCTIQNPDDNPNLKDFLKMAQQGLLEARRQGHNRIVQQNSISDDGPFRY